MSTRYVLRFQLLDRDQSPDTRVKEEAVLDLQDDQVATMRLTSFKSCAGFARALVKEIIEEDMV